MTPLACLLPQRGLLAISGEDRRSFLQGLVSNDINLCRAGTPLYAALLTPQGKFLHDMLIFDAGDHFLIDCEGERIDDLKKRLGLYKLRAKISLENVTDYYSVWAIWGEKKSVPQDQAFDPRLPDLGIRLIEKKTFVPAVTATDFASYDRHRIRLGVPDGSRDMTVEKSTLLEGNMDRLNAISWSKGCYIGQEVTARTHYRGLVKKRLCPVHFEGAAPKPGTEILADGQMIGELRSSCGDIGLALLGIEHIKPALAGATPLLCEDTHLIPQKPEWMSGDLAS